MLNSASIIGRYTLTGTVKLTSPLIIRAGVSNDILNDTVDDIVVTYHDGQPFIPHPWPAYCVKPCKVSYLMRNWCYSDPSMIREPKVRCKSMTFL